MNHPAHKTKGANRSRTVRFYPYVFTGKEKDEETGYGYFGARYMDHELMTMWLSVDPLADKYPSISPYAYCVWNPVKLIDPEGQDVWSVSEDGTVRRTGDSGGSKKQTIKYDNGETAIFNGASYQSILNDLSTGDKKISYSKGSYNKKNAMGELFLSLADNTNVEWDIQKYKGGIYIISTLHQHSRSSSPTDVGMKMSDIITTIHSHPAALANLKDEIYSIGLVTSDGTRETYSGYYSVSDYNIRKCYPDKSNYYIYMRNSHNIYQLISKDGVVFWPVKTGKATKASLLPW